MRTTALLCTLTVLALGGIALAQRTELAFTLGVAKGLPAVELRGGQQGCQGPILVPPGGAFDRVALTLGTYGRAGPRVEIRVRDLESGRILGRGTIAGGYDDITALPEHVVEVGRVPENRRIEVCVANRGEARVAVYGNADAAARTSTATVDGKPTGFDMSLRFETSPRSAASLLDEVADRAALFKLSWAGPWMFWLLVAAVLVAVPLLLVHAVRSVGG